MQPLAGFNRLCNVIANGVMFVASTHACQEIAIYATTAQRSLIDKGMQPTESCVVLWWNNSHTLPRSWATATGEEEFEDEKRKTTWTFPMWCRVFMLKNGKRCVWGGCTFRTFSSPFYSPVRSTVSRQRCFSTVLRYANNHHYPYYRAVW